MIQVITNELQSMHRAKIQLILREISFSYITVLLYFYPDMIGRYLEENMSDRAWKQLCESVSNMIQPPKGDLKKAENGMLELMDSPNLVDKWKMYKAEHNESERQVMVMRGLSKEEMEFID